MSHMNPHAIGVTWPAGKKSIYQRSNFDMKMDKKWNPEMKQCGPPGPTNHYEAYDPFWNRTAFDKKMLKKFDPEYRKLSHEGYQHTRPPPGYAALYDDPYRTWSYQVMQPDMQ